MSRKQWEGNLTWLREELVAYARAENLAVPDPLPSEVLSLCGVLYLAHSTSASNFAAIGAGGRILSASRVAAAHGRSLSESSAEVLLGTSDAVFFYVGPFRYPSSSCGLLFTHTLEDAYRDTGAATPFDSGGLVNVFTRSNVVEQPREFLSRHELPVPDHRIFLGLSLSVLFGKATDYVDGVWPIRSGPIDLTGGAYRRWTHEVRIPREVPLRDGYLQAVFAPVTRVAADPDIENLCKWCEREDVDVITFDSPGDDDFRALFQESRDYISRKLQ